MPQGKRKRLKEVLSTDLFTKQNDALKRAQEAASAGDPKTMAIALVESRVLDGLMRRLEHKWTGSLLTEDIEDAVATAVEALYIHVSKERKTTSVPGFLWKTAFHKAYDTYYGKRQLRSLDDGSVGGEQMAYEDSMLDESTADGSVPRLSHKEIVRQAIAIAREIINEIGVSNLKSVMALTIDFVEKGYEDLTSREIGDILGLKPATVRQCWKRGFERLEKRARARGIKLESTDFINFERDENEETEEDNE